MTRMEIMKALSFHLKGVARRTRAENGDFGDYMIFYLRQCVRHHMKLWYTDDFEKTFREWLVDTSHVMGNHLLKAMGKDQRRCEQRGAACQLFADHIAACVLNHQVIPKPVVASYKKCFRSSKLTYPDWRRYNTDLLAKVTAEAFLISLHPGSRIEVPYYAIDFTLGKVTDRGMQTLSQHQTTRHYLDEALSAAGVVKENLSIELDYRFIFRDLDKSIFWQERFQLYRYLHPKQWNRIVRFSEKMAAEDKNQDGDRV